MEMETRGHGVEDEFDASGIFHRRNGLGPAYSPGMRSTTGCESGEAFEQGGTLAIEAVAASRRV